MYSDLENARRALERAIGTVEHLKSHPPETQEGGARHEAEVHFAKLRTFLARGRVMALERSYHAHQACEDAPREGLRASEAFTSAVKGH
jgi:hypothetical protein